MRLVMMLFVLNARLSPSIAERRWRRPEPRHPTFCTPVTASRIEFGSGSGFSNKPSSGRTIRKWAK